MLARKVVTRSGRKIRGYFPSVKMGRMVAWESLLERDAMLLMEFSPGVLAYREQPARVLYYEGTDQREYFPDLEITLWGDSYLHVEVKPKKKLASKVVADKLMNVAAHYQKNGHSYRVLTDDVIRRQPLLSNLHCLFYLKRLHSDLTNLTQQFSLAIAGQKNITFDSATGFIGRNALLRLIASGWVVCDLERPLSGDNPVRFPGEADHAALLF